MRMSLSIVYITHQHCRRSSPCWAARRIPRATRHPVITRMPAGITGSCRRANLTTRRRQVDVSEDNRHHCPITRTHSSHIYQFDSTRMRPYMWIQWCVALASHLTAVRLVLSCVYVCTDVSRGLGVQAVSGSFSGNLHPTPCIEWMQGKRGDPGCMAKAATLVLLSVRIFHACIRVPHPLLSFG